MNIFDVAAYVVSSLILYSVAMVAMVCSIYSMRDSMRGASEREIRERLRHQKVANHHQPVEALVSTLCVCVGFTRHSIHDGTVFVVLYIYSVYI